MQSGVIGKAISSAHSPNTQTPTPTTPTPTKTVPIQLTKKTEAEKIKLRNYILKSNR